MRRSIKVTSSLNKISTDQLGNWVRGGDITLPPNPLYSRGRILGRNPDNLLQFLLYTVKEKGGKPDRKPYPIPFGLRNPYRNLKSENSQDYAQKRNYTFMISGRIFKDDVKVFASILRYLLHD
jgi:hypothetical protein